MYELTEQKAVALAARQLIRIDETRDQRIRFFAPDEPILVDFGDRRLLPLTEGYCHRTIRLKHANGPESEPLLSLELYGFNEDAMNSREVTVGGIWGPQYHKPTRGKAEYRGTVDLLPPELLRAVNGLLSGTSFLELDELKPKASPYKLSHL